MVDTVKVRDFRQSLKVMFDTARTTPVYVQRGDEVFEVKLYGKVGLVKTLNKPNEQWDQSQFEEPEYIPDEQ